MSAYAMHDAPGFVWALPDGPVLSAEQARQFALDVLDACDDAERLHQQADPDGYAQGLRDLIQAALNDDPTTTDGDTIVRSID